MDNAFAQIEDFPQAQRLADRIRVAGLHRRLDHYARLLCPVIRHFEGGYDWCLMQTEYATDIVFRRQADLAPLYADLSRLAIHLVKPEQVATFPGRKLHGGFRDELGNDVQTRIQGTRIRHQMGPVALKVYDKLGLVLRIETVANRVDVFKHDRMVEHRDGRCEKKMAPVRKTIYSLSVLAEVMGTANGRYLEFLGALGDPTVGLRDLEKISRPVWEGERPHWGFNLFAGPDLELFEALARGEFHISGFKNRDLRRALPGTTGPQVSWILKGLRPHGLIWKVGRTYTSYLTRLGRVVVLTALKLRQMYIVPSLRGWHPA